MIKSNAWLWLNKKLYPKVRTFLKFFFRFIRIFLLSVYLRCTAVNSLYQLFRYSCVSFPLFRYHVTAVICLQRIISFRFLLCFVSVNSAIYFRYIVTLYRYCDLALISYVILICFLLFCFPSNDFLLFVLTFISQYALTSFPSFCVVYCIYSNGSFTSFFDIPF